MNPDTDLRDTILDTLSRKACLKQHVYDNTVAVFGELKDTLHEFLTDIDETLEDRIEENIKIEYRDHSKFEAMACIAEDILVFKLNTDVYRFPKDHAVWQHPYVGSDPDNAYCGIINIYNFLNDSFRYNRGDDEGYLIGRIFVNRNSHYFVDGKCRRAGQVERFGDATIDRTVLTGIIETAIDYALNFDLLVPPYEFMQKVDVEPFNTRSENVNLQTGKLLGREFTLEERDL